MKASSAVAVVGTLALSSALLLLPNSQEVAQISTAEPGPDTTHQQILDSLARIEAHLGTTPPPPTTDPEPDPEPTNNTPQNFRTTADQDANKILLAWDEVPNATEYKIYEDNWHGVRTFTASVTETSSLRGPLEDNFTYSYAVSAVVDGVESEPTVARDVTLGVPTTETTPPPPDPEPTDPPTSDVIPDTVTEQFRGFDTGDFAGWGNIQQEGYNSGPDGYAQNYRLAVVNDGAGHETAARFELRPGDVPPFGGDPRTEITGPDALDVNEGEEVWYEFDLKFENFPPPEGLNSGGHLIVMQWHTGSSSPLLSLNVDGHGNFTVYERWNDPMVIGPTDDGNWHHYVLHVKFGQSDDAFIEVWKDGTFIGKSNRANMRDADNYFKLGIYSGDESDTRSLLYDNFVAYK